MQNMPDVTAPATRPHEGDVDHAHDMPSLQGADGMPDNPWAPMEMMGDFGRKSATEMVETTGSPVEWPDQEDLLGWCREMDTIVAAVLLFAGVIYTLFGYGIFKLLACANIAGLGVWGGWWLGKQVDAPTSGMVIGGVLAAAVAWPAIRYAVAGCGGIVGFVIGCAVWRAFGLADVYAPAGGAIGAIFLFMLTFVLFKISVITFTAIQGVIMLVGGLLAIVLKYPEFDDPVTYWTSEQPVILPVVLLALSIVGVFYQQHYNRESSPGKG